MRAVTVLLVPDDQLAFRILALNTEKAHNLRDRSMESHPDGTATRERAAA